MKLKFWGVRGSRPTHKKELIGYGGNSTSMEFVLEKEDFHIFLDGGSGLVACGRTLGENPKKKKIYFVITHTHWDHIMGFPYFLPFRNANMDFTFFASTTSKSTFSDLFLGLQRSRHLPVPPFLLHARIKFESKKSDADFFVENKVRIRTHQINHQGITLGYRLEYEDKSVAVITDNAPIDHGNYLGEGMKENAASDPKAFERDFDEGMVRFLRDCHTAVFDTHFTEANLKPDWGHSTPERALEYCKKAHVKRLVLFHHAPEDSDTAVDQKVAGVLEDGRNHGVEVVAAREGDVWTLSN